MDLNDVDFLIIHKNKIDPLDLFDKDIIYLSMYVIFLIKNDIEVDSKLFDEVGNENRYGKRNTFPYIESICFDVLQALVLKGKDIMDKKYKELILGLQSNDSSAENFCTMLARVGYDIPEDFYYLYDDSKDSYYFISNTIDDFIDKKKNIPDFLIKNIGKDPYYIIQTIKIEDKNPSFKKQKEFLYKKIIQYFNNSINKSKDIEKVLKNPDYEKIRKNKKYIIYREMLPLLESFYNLYNVFYIKYPKFVLNFINGNKMNNYLQSSKVIKKHEDDEMEYYAGILRRVLEIASKIKSVPSFKEYFF